MTNISIEQIRHELTWKLRQKVLYPDKKIFEMEMEEDTDGMHFGAFQNNQLVAIVSLFHQGVDYQFRKFAVDASVQKMGIGSSVLNYITDFVAGEGGSRLWCNARLPAIPFYVKHGFSHSGQLFSKHGFKYELLEKIINPALAHQLAQP
jgi:GNAT superfamily N-acetyltransferase